MVTKVQKWGNSQGLRIAKNVLEDAQISIGDEVNVEVREGVIMISPSRRVRGKHCLKDLVKRIPKDYVAEEIGWGKPTGKEVW